MARFMKKAEPGRFYLRAGRGVRLVKPGDVIECSPEELGKHIDRFDRLDPEPPAPKQEAKLKAVPHLDGGYDIVSEATGEPINDAPVTKEQAEEMTGEAIEDDDKNIDETEIGGNIAIGDLSDIPPNTIAVLKKAGLLTVADIDKLTDEELLDIPGIAEKSLAIVREACDKAIAGDTDSDGNPE